MNLKKFHPRRDFVKLLGLGAISLSSGVSYSFTDKEEDDNIHSEKLGSINGYEFEAIYKGGFFQGIGKVIGNGTQLRSGRLPLFALITTPEGLQFINFKIRNFIQDHEGIRLDFDVCFVRQDTMEWMLHTVRNRRNLSDWTKGPETALDTTLSLELKPVVRTIGGLVREGFSYQYTFRSNACRIYKITDRASWEIGGNAIGNEFWMRNGVVDSIKEFENAGDFYSTEWYLPGINNPNIFQFHPLQTHLQGFTYTVASEGAIITFPSRVSHIRSLFEKWRNADEIVHFHEHCSDLDNGLATSPVEVFWLPGIMDKTERSNLYYNVREAVHNELHNQSGIKRERISTYGIIEEWTEPDFERYTRLALPRLLDAGIKTIFIPNQCENDMNTWGLSNMCCNVDYRISSAVGEEKLKRFCKEANQGGAKVEMWGNTAISTLSERFMHKEGVEKGIKFLKEKDSIAEVIQKAKSPFIRNASNAIEADHYTPRFCALNLCDEDIRKYWMKQWKYFHDEIGIRGIFLDSSFNMSSDKFHHLQYDEEQDLLNKSDRELQGSYRPLSEPASKIQSQYFAHLSLIKDMQKTGYQYCGEDLGVFGINRTGPPLLNRINNLSIWSESYCDFNENVLKEAGFKPIDVYFKGLAYRMMWKIYWDVKRDILITGISDSYALKLIKLYNEVTDFLYNREILANESGVIYHKDQTAVLWSFRNFHFDFSRELTIENLTEGKKLHTRNLEAAKNTIYRILIEGNYKDIFRIN